LVFPHIFGETFGELVRACVIGATREPSAFVMIVGCACASDAVLPNGGGGAGAGGRTLGSCLETKLSGVGTDACGGITMRGVFGVVRGAPSAVGGRALKGVGTDAGGICTEAGCGIVTVGVDTLGTLICGVNAVGTFVTVFACDCTCPKAAVRASTLVTAERLMVIHFTLTLRT